MKVHTHTILQTEPGMAAWRFGVWCGVVLRAGWLAGRVSEEMDVVVVEEYKS